MSALPRRGARAHKARIDIIDPGALATLLLEIVTEDFEGVQAAAAKAAHIDPTIFSRLCQQRKSGLTAKTLDKLYQFAFERGREERLEAVLATPMMRRLGEDQNEWEWREWDRLRHPERDLVPWDASGLKRCVLLDDRATDDQIARHYTDEGRALLRRLRGDQGTRTLLEEFSRRVNSRETDDEVPVRGAHATLVWRVFDGEGGVPPVSMSLRAAIAMLRVLQPLLVATSAPLERSWRELHGREMTAYIRAATRAEFVLLNREPYQARARTLSAQE